MKEVRGKKEPSLIKAIARTFWREYALLGFIQFFNGMYWFGGKTSVMTDQIRKHC